MKHLQIFVIVLIVGLGAAQRGSHRGEGPQGRRFPGRPKSCSSDSDCPTFATCVNMGFVDKSICLPKKMVDMMEKKLSQLPSLKGCSVDGDCENGKCGEVQNLGVRMCMPAFVSKMLHKKSTPLVKTCTSENECSGSSKCIDFPKFEKQMCFAENGPFHKLMVIIHDKFIKEDKEQPEINTKDEKDDNKEGDAEGPEEGNDDNDDDNDDDGNDDDMDKAPFISDPQFLTKIDDNDGKFKNFLGAYESHRRRSSWNMFFMGVFSMAGFVVIILFALLCCLTVRKRMAKRSTATEESGEGGNKKLRNVFLTKISAVPNPYSKLEEEKGVRI